MEKTVKIEELIKVKNKLWELIKESNDKHIEKGSMFDCGKCTAFMKCYDLIDELIKEKEEK